MHSTPEYEIIHQLRKQRVCKLFKPRIRYCYCSQIAVQQQLDGGFSLLSSSGTDYQIFNNVIKGINGIGFLYKGYDCGDSAQK
jgi:hypothetical protein